LFEAIHAITSQGLQQPWHHAAGRLDAGRDGSHMARHAFCISGSTERPERQNACRAHAVVMLRVCCATLVNGGDLGGTARVQSCANSAEFMLDPYE
jgi:hypothetical protein